jgi:hypothetical protein
MNKNKFNEQVSFKMEGPNEAGFVTVDACFKTVCRAVYNESEAALNPRMKDELKRTMRDQLWHHVYEDRRAEFASKMDRFIQASTPIGISIEEWHSLRVQLFELVSAL